MKNLRFCGLNFLIPLTFVALLLISPPVKAQLAHWTKCDTGYVGPNGFAINPNSRFGGRLLMAPYFVNPQFGFAYESNVAFNGVGRTHPRLYRTEDSAQTWQLCDTNTITGGITYMCFLTPGHGYLATAFDTGKVAKIPVGGIYETMDTGNSWVQISPSGDFSQVWVAGKTLFAVQYYNSDPITFITTNDGRNWTVLGDSVIYITGDGNNYVVLYEETKTNALFLKYSIDGGLTWAFDSLLGVSIDQDEPLCFPGTYTLLDLDDALMPPLIRQLNLYGAWDTLPDLDSVTNKEVILDDARRMFCLRRNVE